MTTAAGDAGAGVVSECVFCRIIAGEIPAAIVWESDLALAFRDLAPAAPVHVLVVPKHHVDNALSLEGSHGEMLADLLVTARRVAEVEGVAASGFRLVFNVGDDGGNTVGHLHLHVLGGRQLAWPPG